MRYWWILGMIACFGLQGQSPELIAIHLFIDEAHHRTLWQVEIVSQSPSTRSLSLAPGVELLESRALQENLPLKGLAARRTQSGWELPGHQLATAWILHLQWTHENLTEQLQVGGLSWDHPTSWPIRWPDEWVCPLAFSLQLSDSSYDFQYALDPELAVSEPNGQISWFFPSSAPMSPNDLQLWVGKKPPIVAVEIPEVRPPVLVPEQNAERTTDLTSHELEKLIASASPSDSSLYQDYMDHLEALWAQQNAKACSLPSDSFYLLGKPRDAELAAIENKLFQPPFNPLAFVKSLDHWRYASLRNWQAAMDAEVSEDAGDRSLQHGLLRRSAYSKMYPVFDPTGDTASLPVRLRKWYLAQMNDSLRQIAWCQLLNGRDFPVVNPLQAVELWQKVVREEVLPAVHLSFRHDRSVGKVYVYAEQIQKEAVDIHSQLLIRSADTTAYFPLVLHKASDTLQFNWQPSISYVKADPAFEQPVWWQVELSDLQRLMWYREASLKADRLEAIDLLLRSNNANLKRTAVGIGLMDEWAEIRIMAVLACAELPTPDWNRLKTDLEKMQLDDPDSRVRSYAADVLLERKSES